MVLHDAKRFDHALASYDKAIALRPDYAEAHHNCGAVLQDLLRLDDAIGAYDKAIKLRPERAESYANQSYCYLQMGRFENGWPLHEWRKRLQTPVGARAFAQPLWLGNENIANKTLFVHWEQGFGDTIQFCRYGKLLTARMVRVVMSVQKPLHRLLKQISPDIQIINQDEVPAAFDYHCPLMSLPFALGTSLETIPSEQGYIFADGQLRKNWDAQLPRRTRPRVGIVWSGNTKHKKNDNRSIALREILPL